MDLLGLPRLPRLRGLPLPRVLRGLLRRRVQGAARQLLGDPPARRPARASATGTCRSAARSSPACAARGTHTIAIDVHLDADAAAKMARDVRAGLCAYPKEVAPKYFYDERGSLLFEQITELPEYYPTRAEREILTTALGRDPRRRRLSRDPGRARLRLGGEDAPPAERDARLRQPRHLRARSTSPRRSPSAPPPNWSTSTRASTCTASSATSSSTWSGSRTAPGRG